MSKAAFAKDQLKSFINRIERLNEEREALSADIREVFAEAKGTGFDTKIMRQSHPHAQTRQGGLPGTGSHYSTCISPRWICAEARELLHRP